VQSLDTASVQDEDPGFSKKEAKAKRGKQQQDSGDLFSILFAN
jgi:hypothetical protein